MAIVIGSYVRVLTGTMTGQVGLVVENTTGIKVLFSDQRKMQYNPKSLEVMSNKAQLVNHRGADYLVTPKSTIISLTTGRIMQWGSENGDRKAILSKLDAKPTPITADFNGKQVKVYTVGGLLSV